MKTNKLLFTIFFACISFIGMSKNSNPTVKIELEDDVFMCNPPGISNLSVSNKMYLDNQNTFTWSPDNSSKFKFYQWLILDEQSNIIDQGKINQATQSYKTFTMSAFKAVRFKVRVVYVCYIHPKLGEITKPGPWSVRNFKVFRSAAAITQITTTGPFCSGSMITFTPAPNTSLNKRYHWIISFGGGLPIQIGTSDNIPPNADPSFTLSIPSPYSGGPVTVYVLPENLNGGFGTGYYQIFTPATPTILDISNVTINLPSSYCPGRSNRFEATPLIAGTEYKWTFRRTLYNSNTSPYPYEETGYEMNEFTPSFGSGNPSGTGTVKSYSVELRVRTGCKPWSNPISTNWINVTYSNCGGPISGISSLSGGNSKSKNQLSDINIHPNPSTSGIFNIDVSGLEGNTTMQVYDMSGKYIIEKTLDKNRSKLDLSNYSKGTYFVKISDGAHQKTQKLVF